MQRYDELPPLNAAQQAETLRLAARLQTDHESQASSEALLRAAAEAGIEERYVREAARQVVGRRSSRNDVARPLVAIGILAFLNLLALFGQPVEAVGIVLPTWLIVLMVGSAFGTALWVGRERRVRWAVPLAIPAIWFALGLPDLIYHTSQEGRGLTWLPALIGIVGGLQFVAATLGALLQNYEPQARTGRLYRPDQP